MPDIFTAESSPIPVKGSDFIQPIREATPLLIGKIIAALLIPLVLYFFVLISSIEVQSLFAFHEDWSLGFMLFLGLITVVQGILVLFIMLQWKNHVYYITDAFIRENRGVFTLTEKSYDVKNVRDISIRQGVLGRMWNFGDIIIESTAPDFHEIITITGAPNPKQHEAFLRKFV